MNVKMGYKFVHKGNISSYNIDNNNIFSRLYLKTFSSKPSPQLFPRLLVYGMSKDDNNMGIISTVNQFTEVSHTAVNLRISYFDFRRAASLNGSNTFSMTKCFF